MIVFDIKIIGRMIKFERSIISLRKSFRKSNSIESTQSAQFKLNRSQGQLRLQRIIVVIYIDQCQK